MPFSADLGIQRATGAAAGAISLRASCEHEAILGLRRLAGRLLEELCPCYVMQTAEQLLLHALESMLQALQLLCCILHQHALSGTFLMEWCEQAVAARAPNHCL